VTFDFIAKGVGLSVLIGTVATSGFDHVFDAS